MTSYRVGMNKTFAIAHKKYKKLKLNYPDCLNEVPFFNYTNESFLRYEIELFFSKYGLTPKIIGEGDDMKLFQVIVDNGLGFVIVPEAAKNRLCLNKDICVLGELEELQTSVWGIVKKSYTGLGHQFLKGKLS